MSIPRRTVLSAAGVAAATAGIGLTAGAAPRAAATRRRRDDRPNFVVILADDLGFSDVGVYGGEIETPNLDSLAATGTMFTGATNNARCCPTRASILTGLYPTQTGVGYMSKDEGVPEYQGRLNDSCYTFAELLGGAGYRTGMFGKWHVGTWKNGVIPASRGFEVSYGPQGGKSSYFRPELYDGANLIGRPTDPDFYLTDELSERAAASITDFAEGDAPFLTYVTYTAPHWPLHAREEDIAYYRERYSAGWDVIREQRYRRQRTSGILPNVHTLPPRDPDEPAWEAAENTEWYVERMAVYAAQVTALDRGVGRILAALEESGVRDNTMVMFLADNGGCAEEIGPGAAGGAVSVDGRPMRPGNDPAIMPGPSDTYASYGRPWANASNTPFDMYKRYTHEGGIATPLLVSWPAKTAKGKVDDRLVHVTDIMPTLVALGGADYPARRSSLRVPRPEGRSLADVLRGAEAQGAKSWDRSRWIFWEHEGNRAVRHGSYKLVAEYGQPWELYDLAKDRNEQVDLAGKRPDLVVDLDRAWQEWASRVRVKPWAKARLARVI